VRANRQREAFRLEVASLLEQYTALLTPVAPSPAPKGLGSTGDPSFCAPWSFVGAPAIALPSGVATAGLPLAVQLTAATGRDDSLLGAALWCEPVINFQTRPALPG
jgi:amidase